MVVGKEDLRAPGEVVAVPRGEVVDQDCGPRDLASCTREVDHEVHEPQGCRHWRKGGWGWSRPSRL